MIRFRFATAALTLAAAAALPPGPATARDGAATANATTTRLAYERFTLLNGLTVLVHTDRTSPSVFVGVWYKTGSRDEPAGKTGFAHLFEHLMFQSTAHRREEFMDALKTIGGIDANGITRTDDTAYFETVPRNALDSILWLESDRMGYLDGGITQALLDEQRRVVLNEKRQGELRPEEWAWRHFLTAFYPPGHPYAHPTIGATADIEGATLDDVKQWFHDHYGAGNAVLVLSGNVEVATAREKVARYFGAIRPGTPISRPLQWMPSFGDTRRDLLYGDYAATSIARSWPIAGADARTRTLLLLAARAMTGTSQSALVRTLVTDEKVATSVSASMDDSRLGSVLTITVDVRPGVPLDAASAALDAAIAGYAAHGPTTERLRGIVAATDQALARAMENDATVGNWLGSGEVVHDDPAYALHQRDWIGTATPEAVRDVAARWLFRPFFELVTMPTPKTDALAADVDRTTMPKTGPVDTTIVFPPVTRFTLANGMTVVVARRSGVGMVDLSLQFNRGTLADPQGTAASAFGLLAAADGVGGGASPTHQLAELGIRVGAAAGPWTSAIDWSAARGQFASSFATVADMVRHPAYPAAAVDDANAAALQAFDARDRNPHAAGATILKRAIWGDADRRGHIATRQEFVPITRQALLDYHGRHIVPNAATLYVVGDVDSEHVRALAERYLGDWKPAVMDGDRLELPKAPPPHSTPRVILIDTPGAPQTSITIGVRVPPFDKDKSAVEALVDAAVAGIDGGRLNRTLRRDKGWTYGFGGGIDDAPAGERLFVAGGLVQADHTADSIAELRREFADLSTTRPLTTAEIDEQRTAMTRAAVQRFDSNAAFLDALTMSGAYRLPADRAATTAARLTSITPDQVRALAGELFHPSALTWVVIGDRKTIEPQLKALAIAPIEVWDLYGRHLQ